MSLQIILLMLTLSAGIGAFKILILYPTPSYSHQRSILALTESLVLAGHEVFAVTPDVVPGLKNENYTYVDVSFSYEFFADHEKDDSVCLQKQLSKAEMLEQLIPYGTIACKQFLSEPFLQFKKRVEDETIKFDVAIMESYYAPHACAMIRLLSGDTPIIAMSTMSNDLSGGKENLGNTQHWSYIPSFFHSYTDKMSLFEKIHNWGIQYYMAAGATTNIESSARTFFRDTYGNESLVDGCWGNASLSLIASNHLYYYPRLLGPNVVETAPMYLSKPPQKLPKNLEDWFNGAEKGVIYFSLGSNMKSKSLPLDVRSNFLKFFSELPPGYRVSWKWELDGKIPGQSDNILAQKWNPQESILAHPKTKVFITQGGLQSFQEAVHYGVPTVGIPWFGDQDCNVAKMVDAEIGVRLWPPELHSFEKIKAAIDAVLYDERYLKNMKRRSAISHDFTAQALEKGVFWVEHVARHGGASHLRPSVADTTYFQFFCLDIITVILTISCIVLYVIIKFLKFVISKIVVISNKKIKIS